ncbi:MAG: YicC family protein [Oscillospiraceae bacterium]|nr:YicC family protein [Oscillospiraceae bacterium]
MIRSMTGYGSARATCAGLDLKLEIKSVNNRYLDCSVRLPRNLLFAEETVKTAVQRSLSRGKADVFVTVEGGLDSDSTVTVNQALAEGYAAAIQTLAERLDLEPGLTAYELSRFPDVLCLEKREADREEVLRDLNALAERAMEDFDAMRRREGQKLRDDIASRLDTIEVLVSEVERRSPETVTEYRERLYKKLCEVLEKPGVDEQRILTEAAVFADRVAVDEETVRLRSHIAQLRGMLETGSPIGRKMDFLIQEFNREANTIGSKCSDGAITKTVIELKSEIEKIREQVQNIE